MKEYKKHKTSEGLFEEVYRAEFSHVWRFLYRMGFREQTTADLTHDVFLMAFRKFETFDVSRPVRPWLFGIAFRIASDFRALAYNQRKADADEAFEDVPADEHADPSRHLEKEEAKEMVSNALNMLSIEQRATFVLHELEERPIPEVADIVGIPVPTAYTRLRAARAKFTWAIDRLMKSAGGSHE